MAGKKIDTRVKRTYRPLNQTAGMREPKRDGMNFADVDRALERWLRKNDPDYRTGSISTSYIDYFNE